MEENNSMPDNEAPAPGSKVCPGCGTVLDPDAKFCHKCGMTAPETPVEPEKKHVDGICDNCGKQIDVGAKFCRYCGAAVPEGSAPVQAPPPGICVNCGNKIDDGAKFCRFCGTAASAVGQNSVSSASEPIAAQAQTQTVASGGNVDKKRFISKILYFVAAGLSIVLGFIFLCTPFMSIDIKTLGLSMGDSLAQEGLTGANASQLGLTLIGVMFGADSDLVNAGVPSATLKWAGWAVLAYLIFMIFHGAILAFNFLKRSKDEKPVGIMQSSCAVFVAGLVLFILSLVTRGHISDWYKTEVYGPLMLEQPSYAAMVSLSTYMGGIGVFVASFVGCGTAVAAYFLENGTYAKKPRESFKERFTGPNKLYYILDVVCAVVVVAFAIVPFVSTSGYNSAREQTIKPGDSGKVATICDESYKGNYVGATVLKLDGLEKGKTYIFRLDMEDAKADDLYGTILLCKYSEVKDKKASTIAEDRLYIRYNDKSDCHDGYATLTFKNDYSYDLAIVTDFVSYGEGKIQYEYSFKMIN